MDERLQQFETKMGKTCEYLAEDYQTIRAGRANPHVLDRIRVEYYGTPTPLQQVGNVTVPEPRMIQISPWEKSDVYKRQHYDILEDFILALYADDLHTSL